MSMYYVSVTKTVTLKKYVKVGAATLCDAEVAAIDISKDVDGFWSGAEVVKENITAYGVHESYAPEEAKV